MGVKGGGLWTFYMQKSGACQYAPAVGGAVRVIPKGVALLTPTYTLA